MEATFLELIKQYGTVALPFGFLSMLIIRSGYYHTDDNLRRSFIILVFATIAYYTHHAFRHGFIMNAPDWCAWLTSFILTIFSAIIWRKWLSDLYFDIINKHGISNENNKGSVLNTILQDTSNYINGLVVYTKDDTILCCSSFDWVRKNIDANAKFLIDETGVYLPVTDIKSKEKTGYTDISSNLLQPEGTCMTYIPKSEIKYYEFIIMKK